MADWIPDLSRSDRPRYVALADAIAEDVTAGRLAAGDRLPPQRALAKALDIDFTTVARGYVEAQKRGLVESRVGQGTFVLRQRREPPRPVGPAMVDLTMNLPPEPDDPVLLQRMQQGLAEVGRDLVGLLRYQSFGGAPADKAAALGWLGRRGLAPAPERVFVTPGAHAALLGILTLLAKPGEVVLCEALTYPGLRALAARLRLDLVGLPMDEEGIVPDALAQACRALRPRALYLNPTLHNPTTLTLPAPRREALAEVVRGHGVPLIEDDAYGFIPPEGPPPFAALAPELTWHVAGLAKCIGAGLRAAYVVAPEARAGWPFAAVLRAGNVMASPLTVALATRWIEDGTADALLRFIREESAARQKIAAEVLAQAQLPPGSVRADPLAFNLWLELPQPWSRAAFAQHMQASGGQATGGQGGAIGVVGSDVFAADGRPPEAVRICLGGPVDRATLRGALDYMAHTLADSPAAAATVL
ncbi:PLP-dependent aminotransferase family protein [Ancylobacter sp. 6x-1]|uniref:PLP-dependent aminotransferase family protein n=1 Tax=Ancylobacter crimeensis TaxID=2579147 RepID=A0ABT0DB84_9HYPH|nr:PLP-dependent aminotransferase family protein [Ancylobacter crimeensis]MCK0197223.1 PLP-dependent aminotransferase family protein [Ancylobacter crimeensis]